MKFSIVTPSFNQAAHLEKTLQSVLLAARECPAELEYLVVDGGSTDGSREVIEKHEASLAYWCSEKDAGQYDAINKGFARSTGDIMAWLNSSDLYLPWTLSTVAEIFAKFPEIQWVTSLRKLCVQEDGGFEGLQKMPGFAGRLYYSGWHGGPKNSDFIQQETVFWRRSLWEKVGEKLPDRCKYAADFHLWAEFFRHAPVYGIDAPLAGFRFHGDSRSTADRYMAEVNALLEEWKKTRAKRDIARGFCTVMRHWEEGQSSWVVKRHGGEEFIWLTKTLEESVTSFLWKLCSLFYLLLKPVLFTVRLFLWPWRKKAPWKY
jgi:glycosyltransferase involved in cell wall biosynthesis